MLEFIRESVTFSYFLVRHIFLMMYWILVPGLILSEFLTLRYQKISRDKLLQESEGILKSTLHAIQFGVTSSTSRHQAVNTSEVLFRQGVHPASVFAFLIASHNLIIYFLAITTLMLGIEFAVGQVLGSLIMILLMGLFIKTLFLSGEWDKARQRLNKETRDELGSLDQGMDTEGLQEVSWKGVLLSFQGWWELTKYMGHELNAFWKSFVFATLLGGFILAWGLTDWRIELSEIANNRILSDILNALISPFISMIVMVSPVGNLLVASALFKSYTIAYPGFVSLVLASLLNPRSIRAYFKTYGKRLGTYITLSLFFSSAIASLIVTGLYGMAGFRPSDVPVLSQLTDKIMEWLPVVQPP